MGNCLRAYLPKRSKLIPVHHSPHKLVQSRYRIARLSGTWGKQELKGTYASKLDDNSHEYL